MDSWMQTYTGRRIHPFEPVPGDVDELDIAHSLSNICRFGGHCCRFYSVGEHTLRGLALVPEESRLWWLLHDASEIWFGDQPRYVKRHPDMTAFRAAEKEAGRVIFEKFGLYGSVPPEIEWVDKVMCSAEMRDLCSPLRHDEQDDANYRKVADELVATIALLVPPNEMIAMRWLLELRRYT